MDEHMDAGIPLALLYFSTALPLEAWSQQYKRSVRERHWNRWLNDARMYLYNLRVH